MSFADTQKPKNSTIKKTLFLDLEAGTYLVRILDKEAYDVYTHYVNRSSVVCLGEDCPICKNNQRLIMESPEHFRDEKGYSSRTRRYAVNVLDKTQVRICPKCGTDNIQAPGYGVTCKSCSEMLGSVPVTTSSKVKVLAKGVSLFDQLNSIDLAVLNESGEPVGITNYDITLIVSGTGKTKTITAVPQTASTATVPEGLELFDLEKTVIRLEPEEMLDLQKGVSLRDIFAARRASAVENDIIDPSDVADAKAQVAALFKN